MKGMLVFLFTWASRKAYLQVCVSGAPLGSIVGPTGSVAPASHRDRRERVNLVWDQATTSRLPGGVLSLWLVPAACAIIGGAGLRFLAAASALFAATPARARLAA